MAARRPANPATFGSQANVLWPCAPLRRRSTAGRNGRLGIAAKGVRTMRRLLLVLPLVALALPAAGCMRKQKPVDPVAEQNCLNEGFERDTTEFVDCVNELSKDDKE
jgi:hypothetical protein